MSCFENENTQSLDKEMLYPKSLKHELNLEFILNEETQELKSCLIEQAVNLNEN
jgi:hypothetical protein